jgi:MYXO-CTERM domain-containing protein
MRRTQVLMAAILLATPAPMLAQSGVNDTDETVEQTDDDGNPRTGLLGLLGLLGLFGLMRGEPNIHVDARRRGGGVDDAGPSA